MSLDPSPSDQSDHSQSLTDKLPLKQGAITGGVAFVAGYLLTLFLIIVAEDDEFVNNLISEGGLLYYNSQFADLELIEDESGQVISEQGFNPLTDDSVEVLLLGKFELELESQVPLFLYHLIPIIVLVAGGFYVAKQVRARDLSTASIAGATLTVGTIGPAVLGAVVFSRTEEGTTMTPIVSDSILFVGLLFPAVFGTLGGILWTQLHPQTANLNSRPIISPRSKGAFVQRVEAYIESNGWQVADQKQVSESVTLLDARLQSELGVRAQALVMVVTGSENEVGDKHLSHLSKVRRKVGSDGATLVAESGYNKEISEAAEVQDISLIAPNEMQSGLIEMSTSRHRNVNISRRAVLYAGAGGTAIVIGTQLGFLQDGLNSIVGGDDSLEVNIITNPEQQTSQLAIEINNETNVDKVELRQGDEVLRESGVSPTQTSVSFDLDSRSFRDTAISPGAYDVVAVDDGEVISTEQIDLTIGDIEITNVSLIDPNEGDGVGAPLISSFEIEFKVSGGDLPIEVLSATPVDGVPTTGTPPENDDSVIARIYPEDKETVSFSPIGVNTQPVYPLATSIYGGTAPTCNGETKTAEILFKFTDQGPDDRRLYVDYKLSGEAIRGGRNNNSQGCPEGAAIDWEWS
ncbi:hypothetical protein ACFQJ7_08545 [Halovenus rubra]|uniref:DUF7978 domain-containing protein n=2 Tax=Halovenus rubra TaxID=869890 RepID=A0ABD5X6H4_9EURY|nr:hypothetical protein [Halovenus rubra]